MKYLIAGLGNIGAEYQNTRHNIGFLILDAWAQASNIVFSTERYGSVGSLTLKGRQLFLLKPATYMNLSGKAVCYWLQKENIPTENLIVLVDDLALPLGKIRLKPSGSDGGHNGLKSINECLGHNNYLRLRFGIGSDFAKGAQVNYVLGNWTPDEEKLLPERAGVSIEAVKTAVLAGTQLAMTQYNNK